MGERPWLNSGFYWFCVAGMAGIVGIISGAATGSRWIGVLSFVGVAVVILAADWRWGPRA